MIFLLYLILCSLYRICVVNLGINSAWCPRDVSGPVSGEGINRKTSQLQWPQLWGSFFYLLLAGHLQIVTYCCYFLLFFFFHPFSSSLLIFKDCNGDIRKLDILSALVSIQNIQA